MVKITNKAMVKEAKIDASKSIAKILLEINITEVKVAREKNYSDDICFLGD